MGLGVSCGAGLGAELLATINILANADVVVSTCVGAANELIMQAVGATAGGGPIRCQGGRGMMK